MTSSEYLDANPRRPGGGLGIRLLAAFQRLGDDAGTVDGLDAVRGVETGDPVGGEMGTRFDLEPYCLRERGALWEIIVLHFNPKQGS